MPQGQSCFDDVVVAVPQSPQRTQHKVPTVRRVAQLKQLGRFRADAAVRRQIVVGISAGLPPQLTLIECGRVSQQAAQLIQAVAARLLLGRLRFKLDARFLRQFPQRLFEIPAVNLLREGEEVSAFGACAKTAPALSFRIDDE